MRLDVYLAENKMIKSRELAKKMISEGGVTVNGEVVTKPAKEISEEDEVKVTAELPAYVGRGGLKLEKALDSFHIDVSVLTQRATFAATPAHRRAGLPTACSSVGRRMCMPLTWATVSLTPSLRQMSVLRTLRE